MRKNETEKVIYKKGTNETRKQKKKRRDRMEVQKSKKGDK